MKKSEQGERFTKLHKCATDLGFSVEEWRIKENAAGDGCIVKMRLSAKDDPEDAAGIVEGRQ